MRLKVLKDLGILILILAALGLGALGISRITPSVADTQGPESKLTLSWERTLSEYILEHLERQYASKMLTEEEYREPLDEMVIRLEKAVEEAQAKPLPFEITLLFIDSPVENAYAFPGGIIVINSGLVRITETPEQLAAVIAHEMGHVFYRDSINTMSRSIGLSVLLSFGGGSGAAELLEEILRTLVENTFSREQESRADTFAVDIMRTASLPPEALADFFEKLQSGNGVDKNVEEAFKYLSTHPMTSERIEEVRRQATEKKGSARLFDYDWKTYKNSLPGIL